MSARPRAVYLRWGAGRNRADDIASRLGLELVAFPWWTRKRYLAPARHVTQFVHTLAWLASNRPSVVFSHHTQPFCSLAAVLYGEASGAKVVTDCHNGPFVDPIWLLPPVRAVHRFVFRRATLNLVHNASILRYATEVLRMPGRFEVLHDIVPAIEGRPDASLPHPCAVAICSYARDEPIDVLVEAARRLPDVTFLFTGRPPARHPALRALPRNVRLTGFLEDAAYDALLLGADAAIALSTRDHVLMRAIHEAVGAELPLVTSRGAASERYLGDAAVFVENSPEGVAEGVARALADAPPLRAALRACRDRVEREWGTQASTIRAATGLRAD